MDDDDAYDESLYSAYIQKINEIQGRLQLDRTSNVKTLNSFAWSNGQMVAQAETIN